MSTFVFGSSIPTAVVVRNTVVQPVAQPAQPVLVVASPAVEVVVDSATQRLIQTGQQGLPGPQGEPGVGDNETFDTNLSLLYAVAKI